MTDSMEKDIEMEDIETAAASEVVDENMEEGCVSASDEVADETIEATAEAVSDEGSAADDDLDDEDEEIPEDAPITRLNYEGKEIILIGTAHVSKMSVDLVRKVIAKEQPDSVCIELDEKRYENIRNPQAWENTDVVKVIKSHRTGFMIVNLALSSYQKKMAKKLDTPVGGEMLQGISAAEACGAKLVLADRDIQTTFLRIWRKLRFGDKTKLLYGLIFSEDDDKDGDEISEESLQKMMESDMLESVIQSIGTDFPTIAEVLIHERDCHLAVKIREAPGPKVVAVLGAAHVPGVSVEIYKDQDMEQITSLPKKGVTGKIIGWLIPATILALLVYGFVNGGLQNGLHQLSMWVLLTGSLSAIFTALSLAHPLSILTSFVAAPLTTLHPLLASGWFAGLVEASLRKPTVKDIHSIQTDIFSFKGFFRNRFLKILMVVVMSNIGASIGTFIGGTTLIRNLFG